MRLSCIQAIFAPNNILDASTVPRDCIERCSTMTGQIIGLPVFVAMMTLALTSILPILSNMTNIHDMNDDYVITQPNRCLWTRRGLCQFRSDRHGERGRIGFGLSRHSRAKSLPEPVRPFVFAVAGNAHSSINGTGLGLRYQPVFSRFTALSRQLFDSTSRLAISASAAGSGLAW